MTTLLGFPRRADVQKYGQKRFWGCFVGKGSSPQASCPNVGMPRASTG